MIRSSRLLKAVLLALAMLLPPAVHAQIPAEPLPLVHTPTGMLFRVKAPGAESVYLAGTFNGWGGSDGNAIQEPTAKMFGPDEEGVFEIFAPLTPGTHIFKYAINGNQWIPGPPDLPRAKDDFDNTPGQRQMMGSAVDFSLQEPPWPSYVPTVEMLPVAFTHQQTGEGYLRVRFFSRHASQAHVVGSWDGWQGISNRTVSEPRKAMQPTPVPNVWESYIGPISEGFVQYKIVANTREWLSDPCVTDVSQDGNSVVYMAKQPNGQWLAQYTPRFAANQVRTETKKRWGGTLDWEDDRNAGFAAARLTGKKLFWVITLPGSRPSENLMRAISADPDLSSQLKDFICLETRASDVKDIIEQRRIIRLPYVVLVDSKYKPVYEKFNPSLAELKTKVVGLE